MATTTRYFKRKLLLSKIEVTPGVDPVPTPALNAIEIRNVQFQPLEAQYQANSAETPFFGNSPEVMVSQAARLGFDIAIAGSGAAGTAPAFGPLLRGAGFAERIIAAAVTGTAQGGSANTIQLAAGASAVDNAYKGTRIRLTGGTGSGQDAVIRAYNGTTKTATVSKAWTTPPNATTLYSIDAQVSYSPVSAGHESLTHYMYMDGLRHVMSYSRGGVSLKLTPKNLPLLSFDFLSMYAVPTDLALPTTAIYSSWKTPLPVLNAFSSGAELMGFGVNLYDLSLDLGNQVVHRDDVIGIDDVLITNREPGGSSIIQAPLQAEHDYYTDAQTAALGHFAFTHGTAAGARMRLNAPAMQVKAPKYGESNNVATLGLDLRPCRVEGDDELFLIFD